MIRIGVLVSGSGTNLQAIIDACASGRIDGRIAIVISDKPGANALQRAAAAGIENTAVLPGDYASRAAFDRELVEILKSHEVDLVVLAGFMRIVTPDFVRSFPGRIMNIHPALLPAFAGLTVRQKAIDHGVRFSGCTVHFLDEGVDTGPIIIQAACPVFPDDTEAALAARIQKLEHRIYPQAIQFFAQGRLEIQGRLVLVRDWKREEDACLINPPIED